VEVNEDLSREREGSAVFTAGWGGTSPNDPEPGPDLLSTDLELADIEMCDEVHEDLYGFGFGGGKVCATDPNGDSDACFGDSGGPLYTTIEPQEQVLIGLVSHGDPECVDTHPGLYTQVAAYKCWLEGLEVPGITSVDGPCQATPFAPVKQARGGIGNSGVCFPEDATVELESGVRRTMKDLRIGDVVRTGPATFEPVFYFSHRDFDATGADYVEIVLEDHSSLTLTANHLLPVVGGDLLPAGEVRAHETQLFSSQREPKTVVQINMVAARGLFNPHTASGEIVVNGVTASCMTTYLPRSVATLLLLPERMIYEKFGFSLYGSLLDVHRPPVIDWFASSVSRWAHLL